MNSEDSASYRTDTWFIRVVAKSVVLSGPEFGEKAQGLTTGPAEVCGGVYRLSLVMGELYPLNSSLSLSIAPAKI